MARRQKLTDQEKILIANGGIGHRVLRAKGMRGQMRTKRERKLLNSALKPTLGLQGKEEW